MTAGFDGSITSPPTTPAGGPPPRAYPGGVTAARTTIAATREKNASPENRLKGFIRTDRESVTVKVLLQDPTPKRPFRRLLARDQNVKFAFPETVQLVRCQVKRSGRGAFVSLRHREVLESRAPDSGR